MLHKLSAISKMVAVSEKASCREGMSTLLHDDDALPDNAAPGILKANKINLQQGFGNADEDTKICSVGQMTLGPKSVGNVDALVTSKVLAMSENAHNQAGGCFQRAVTKPVAASDQSSDRRSNAQKDSTLPPGLRGVAAQRLAATSASAVVNDAECDLALQQAAWRPVRLWFAEEPSNDKHAEARFVPRISSTEQEWRALENGITFAAEPELPQRISLHPKTGVITGELSKEASSMHRITMSIVAAVPDGLALGSRPLARCFVAV